MLKIGLKSEISNLPRTTKPLIAALKKLGIVTVRDLLFYFPYRYLDFSKFAKIKDLRPEEAVTIEGTIKNIEKRFSFRSHMSLAEAIVSDDTGSIKIVWFNQGYLADSIQKGDKIFLAGTPEQYKGSLQLTNPIFEKASDFPIHTARLVPVYHLSQKIYPKTFRNLIASVLSVAEEIEEPLPSEIIESQKLLAISDTVRFSHFPESTPQVERAKTRLAFEEIFLNQLAAQKYKLELKAKKSYAIKFDQQLIKDFIARLPFELTPAQKKAAWDILQDIEKTEPMNRLLEGDVGSGKTLVAMIAALESMVQGFQTVILSPTEILASQHFQTALKFLGSDEKKEIRNILLTKSFSKINGTEIDRKKLLNLISEGMPGLYIGTHALLEEKVKFKKLALVIIDEQHRFGVQQRSTLLRFDNKVPHLLSLSATPIPRTLQLAYYGELDISQIRSKPLGRKTIVTKLIAQDNRDKAYKFIDDQIKAGRQAFVVTPLVEESDKLGVKAATSEVKNLGLVFPQYKIALLHGRLKGKEKEAVMAGFLANKAQILVSTSVVEVGVDIPNASVMLIEGAERFGLAQLHQFRGRVGRAEHQSFCFLFTDSQNQESVSRLEAFTQTSDGFELAELDLKQRGFGDMYGSMQSGWNFKYFSPAYTQLIEPAKQEAIKLLQDGLNLVKFPLLKEKIQNHTIHFE